MTARQRVAAAVAVIALVMFCVVHVDAAVGALWSATPPAPVTAGSPREVIATGLTGLVSGVFAAYMGVPASGATPAAARRGLRARAAARLERLQTLLVGDSLCASFPRVRALVSLAYVGAYLAVALLAIATLAFASAIQPFTRDLALISLGILLAVANSFIASPSG